MGRVQADLPENSKSTDGTAAPAADDLLAQLAGEDIDRLLAEAEVEATPIPAATSGNSIQSQAAAADQTELKNELDALLKEMDPPEELPVDARVDHAASASEATTSDGIATSENAELAANIDGPLSEIGDSALQEPESLPAVDYAAADSQIFASPTLSDASEVSDGSDATPVVENALAEKAIPAQIRAGNTEPVSESRVSTETSTPAKTSAESTTSTVTHDSAQPAAENDGRVPFYIRLLEILNSPLDALPDWTREAIGKIALVTLLNAAAVIGYVLLFRKK